MSEQYLATLAWRLEHSTAADRRRCDEVTGRMAADVARLTRRTMCPVRWMARWLHLGVSGSGTQRVIAASGRWGHRPD